MVQDLDWSSEGLFKSDYCRSPSAVFDPVQSQEAKHATSRAMKLLSELN